jgi:4'-phosphopantetheinyl transferase
MIALAHEAIAPGEGHERGRALLRQLYFAHRGMEMPEIVLEERGKPRFVEDPIHFSITHTPNHVFCAISDRPIGIDAEELDRKLNLRIAERILSPAEKAQLEAAANKPRALLTFWVLKEAAAKHTGQGINANPNKTNFSLDDPRVQVIENCLVAIIET